MNYKISPSELTFFYNGCKRCFYLKVRHGIAQPSIPLPSIFTKIAGLLKDHYHGKRTEELHPGLPPGVIEYGERWVESRIISAEGHLDTCFIKGRFDIVAHFDDGTYGIIDYKTGNPEGGSSGLYSRQLHAYALENPARGALNLAPISKLGLIYFHPTAVSQESIEKLSFNAEITLVDIERNEREFNRFITGILGLLESSTPPAPASDCTWCKYLRSLGHLRET